MLPLPGIPDAPTRSTDGVSPQTAVPPTEPDPASTSDPTVASAPPTEAPPSTVPTDPAEVLPPNLAVGALPSGEPFAVAGEIAGIVKRLRRVAAFRDRRKIEDR